MKLHEALEVVRRQGRNGDSELAHVNPREAAILRAMGGSGTVNPKTGLREYYDEGGGTAAGSYGIGSYDTNEPQDVADRASFENAGIPVATGPMADYVNNISRTLMDPATFSTPASMGFTPAVLGGIASFLGGLLDPSRPTEPASLRGFAEGGNPYEPRGEQIAMAAQASPSFVRSEMAMPGELSPFLSSGMSPLQQRSAIGTFGTQGVNPAFRSDAARKYYASLLSQELVKPGGSFNENAYMLPVEQQYLGSAFGRNVTTPQQSYEAIRGFL